MKSHRLVWVFVVLHFALAVWYAMVTPYRQGGYLMMQRDPKTGIPQYAKDIGAPDERQHVNYVKKIAEPVLHGPRRSALPIFDPKDPNLYENYQSHQPPLFYVWGASVAISVNPDTEAGGRALRILNALIGAVTVLAIYQFVRNGFKNQSVALAAAAFASLLPMNLALSGAVSNDPFLFLWCTLTLGGAALATRRGWVGGSCLGCGIAMGMAFLTKTTAIALWPAIATAYFCSFTRCIPEPISYREPLPHRIGRAVVPDVLGKWAIRIPSKWEGALVVLFLPLLIASPWWLRNLNLYGDPFAMKAFTQAFQGSPQASVFINAFGPADYWLSGSQSGTGVLWWTLRSFFGVFGYMDIFLPKALYGVLLLLLAVVLAARFLRGKEVLGLDPSDHINQTNRKTKVDINPQSAIRNPQSIVSLMGGIFFFLVLALFLRFNAQYFQGQARYLLPAIAPISATIGIGVIALFGKRQAYAPWAIAAVLLPLNLYVLSILPGEFEKRLTPPPISQIANPSTSS